MVSSFEPRWVTNFEFSLRRLESVEVVVEERFLREGLLGIIGADKHRWMSQKCLLADISAPRFAERVLRNIRPGSRGSLRLDVGRPDHLAPFLGFVGDEL